MKRIRKLGCDHGMEELGEGPFQEEQVVQVDSWASGHCLYDPKIRQCQEETSEEGNPNELKKIQSLPFKKEQHHTLQQKDRGLGGGAWRRYGVICEPAMNVSPLHGYPVRMAIRPGVVRWSLRHLLER